MDLRALFVQIRGGDVSFRLIKIRFMTVFMLNFRLKFEHIFLMDFWIQITPKLPPNNPQTTPQLDLYKFWGAAPRGFFENPLIFDPWGQPWGPLEAEGRPAENLWKSMWILWDILAYNGPFEAIFGHREHQKWIRSLNFIQFEPSEPPWGLKI